MGGSGEERCMTAAEAKKAMFSRVNVYDEERLFVIQATDVGIDFVATFFVQLGLQDPDKTVCVPQEVTYFSDKPLLQAASGEFLSRISSAMFQLLFFKKILCLLSTPFPLARRPFLPFSCRHFRWIFYLVLMC